MDTQGHKQTDIEREEANKQAAKAEADEQYHREIDRRTLNWNAITAIATAVLVFIGLGGVIAALKTLNAIKRQGELMEVAQSASVGIVGITLVDPTSELNSDDTQAAFERSRLIITMKNTGSSKALKVRLTVNVIVEGIPGLVTTPEDLSGATASDIHPDVFTERIDFLSERLPNSKGMDWQYAVAGKLRLNGTLAYEDIFGNDFETEYTARSLGVSNRFPFTVRFELIANEKKITTRRTEKKKRQPN